MSFRGCIFHKIGRTQIAWHNRVSISSEHEWFNKSKVLTKSKLYLPVTNKDLSSKASLNYVNCRKSQCWLYLSVLKFSTKYFGTRPRDRIINFKQHKGALIVLRFWNPTHFIRLRKTKKFYKVIWGLSKNKKQIR